MVKKEDVRKFNSGKANGDFLFNVVIEFIKSTREKVFQRFFNGKTDAESRKFVEFLLIELTLTLLSLDARFFFMFLNSGGEHFKRLKEVLKLRYLTDFDKYKDFKRKRKYYSLRLDRAVKRNLKLKDCDTYLLDTTPIDVDLNRLRRGKKIKAGVFDARFIYDSKRGVVPGYTAAVLVNLSNLSLENVEFYPQDASKKRIWKEMVLDRLGTTTGKVKAVLADAGFFAYENYTSSPNLRVMPVIKPKKGYEEKVGGKLKNLEPNLKWFDKRHRKAFSRLLEEFHEIIGKAVQALHSYEDFAGLRAEIEMVFKYAKRLFGMEKLHVYYRDHAFSKIYFILYISSLLLQFLKDNSINTHRFIANIKSTAQPF